VLWLRLDLSKSAPPVGPAYGEHVVKRVKECLGEIEWVEAEFRGRLFEK